MNIIRNQIHDALRVSPYSDGEGFETEFSLNGDFVGFEGHFPGNPVLPGICLITACLVAAGEALGSSVKMSRLKSAKFFSPVAPGDKVAIKASFVRGDTENMLKAQISCEQRRVAQIILGYFSPAEGRN